MNQRQRLIATYGREIADEVARLDKLHKKDPKAKSAFDAEIDRRALRDADPYTAAKIKRSQHAH